MSKLIERCVRVVDHRGDLRHVVPAAHAMLILQTGVFRAVRRGQRIRALVPCRGDECAALQVMGDLDALTWDCGAAVRPGRPHRQETGDNPRGVLTFARIPASLRPAFTAVSDSCTT